MTPSGESYRPDGAGFTRRGFLAAALAASAAGAAWARLGPRRRPPIEGAIVGASHRAGHLLRGGRLDASPKDERERAVVVVGGGVAGLSAAWKLAKSGFDDFELLELEAEVGGNARSGESAATPYPWGAHYVPAPTTASRAVRELFEELGVIADWRAGEPVYDERYVCHAPEERLFIHGRWQEGLFPRDGMTRAEAEEVGRFRERMRGFRERHAFAIPMERGARDADVLALDAITAREFMDREGFRSERLRWYVDYCCRDDYGCALETTSAWAAVHYFASREVEEPAILTWPAGNGWLVRRLAARFSGRIACGALVHRIAPEGAGVLVDYLDTATGAVRRVHARLAIFALPRFLAPRVIEGYAPPWVADFTYAPWMVANLHVARLPDEAAWDNVLHRSPALGYVVATHQALRAAPGPSVLTYYRPFAEVPPAEARRAMLARRWEDWRDEVLADLARAHPRIAELVERIDVMLFGHAMIRPVPGFATGAARRAAAEPFGSVLFAHSDMSGLSLFEEAQWRGVKAAEDALSRLGRAFSSSL
jgi:phytoene dehydrogenase-like protein